jgi:hypothetical protein
MAPKFTADSLVSLPWFIFQDDNLFNESENSKDELGNWALEIVVPDIIKIIVIIVVRISCKYTKLYS